ncbi:hypothetical protein BWI17_20065 [Betaproteobacteria bacterium GR16-43]|nr:hypothetical protein BWI17_20065 [Betaproteobacteria bacterium GR16-43]
MEAAAFPVDVERVLEQKTVRDATSRALFLAAIRELGRENGPFTIDRLEQFMRVEEHFQALLIYDQLDFLRQPFSAMEAERDFALNVQRICLEGANGFQRYLRTRNQWAETREAVDAMFRVTGLAVHAIHSYVKWGYFLNEAGRTTPWKQLHALYGLAESDGYAQVPFVLHPSQPSFKPSVQSLYLRTLILDLLNTGNLSKVQIEIADGWYSSWCSDYALDTTLSTRQHLFYVDLASESGMHILRKDSHGDSVRYVRADGLKAQIEEVQAGLRHGRLYAGYGAGAVFPVEEHVALLEIIEKLYHSILAGSENRIEERTHYEDREVDVAIGIELVMRKLREPPRPAPPPAALAPASAPTIDPPSSGLSLEAVPAPAVLGAAPAPVEDPDFTRLRVLDLSSKGYGLLVDRLTSDAILLNGILGLRDQENGGLIVGQVVRKLPNRVRGEMLLGVEVLSYRPLPISLKREGAEAVQALFLPGAEKNGRHDAILVRVSDFAPDRIFVLASGGGDYQLRLNRIIKKGADWITVRFEIVARA